MQTVHSLRSQGFKIRVNHYRFDKTTPNVLRPRFSFKKQDIDKSEIEEKGGKTIITVTSPDGRTVEAISKCSLLDNFNRKKGVAIALGRAMKKF